MFARDQDLLLYEPNLFRDRYFLGQRRASGSADVAESTLTLTPDDNSLAAAGLAAGHVLTVSGLAYVVDELLADNEATVTRPPVSPTGALIPPRAHSAEPCAFDTFEHQLTAAHYQLLRAGGVEPVNTAFADAPTESQIKNTDALRALECLIALEMIFRAAASGLPDDHPTAQRADWYAKRSAAELSRAVLAIDTDGDGTPDVYRKFTTTPTLRA